MDKLIEEAKEVFDLAVEREAENRQDAIDDLRFARLSDQWPDKVRQDREKDGRPCLTINKMTAFIRQVVNDARQNRPSPTVHPVDSAGDPETAKVIGGLMRSIEARSSADIAYDTAVDFAVSCGFGYWRIDVDYAYDDVFDLDIWIKPVTNPFSVYGDPYSSAADSCDWNHAFVTELIPRDEFKRKYKGAKDVDWDGEGYGNIENPWLQDEQVMVAEYWRREEVEKKILRLADGQVVSEEDYLANPMRYLMVPVIAERMTKGYEVTHRVMTGVEVLEERKWLGRYIPIVPVYGEEVHVEGRRYLKSLIRDAKDAQRMFNYWRTTTTEMIALAPKTPYIGRKGAFETDAEKWATANITNHAYIEYDGQERPERQPFAGPPAGAIQEALSASDDIKQILGMYDASLGARSNETSGRAIMARQREGDVSTFHFLDNLTRAIRHSGRIMLDLIPKVYDEERVVRVLGHDNKAEYVKVNGPMQAEGEEQPKIYDLTAGKYDLTVTAGPSFTTRREEAATQMTELVRAYPDAAPVLGDLIAKNLDWPGADEVEERLKALLPPQVRGEDPRIQEAQNVIQQGMAQIQALQQEIEALKASKAAEAQKLRIDAYRAETERIKVTGDLAIAANSPDVADFGAPMAPAEGGYGEMGERGESGGYSA